MDRLKGKTIFIGKEPGQGRLMVAIAGGGKAAAIGAINSVPNSVSRCKSAEGIAHAKIRIDQSGHMTLANLKPQNVTYVNGSEIVSKHITVSDTVQLGRDRFTINIPLVIQTAKNLAGVAPTPPPSPKRYNISHLERVWERYGEKIDSIAQQQQEAGKRRMLPIMIGSFATLASPILGSVMLNTLYFTIPVAAVSFGLYFINYKKKDTSYEDRKAATEEFQDRYVCPNPDCGKFLGNMSYKLLKKQYAMHCPYCKSEFIEK